MVSDQITLDNENVDICLNPRWPVRDYKIFFELANKVTAELNLQSHVWVATSGSTAQSISGIKLVALSKSAILSSAQVVNIHLQATSQDVWAQVLPLFHVGGIGIEARAMLSGARVVQALRDLKWDVQHFAEVLEKEKCTLTSLVPTQVFDLVQARLQAPKHLRAIVVGGGALSASLYQSARALGWSLLPSYGMSETCSQIATASLSSLAQNEIPPMNLLSHVKVKTNAEGFLLIQSPSLLTCYAQVQAGVAKHWDPKQVTWFQTEDKVLIRDSELQILGRAQDYIKIGGETVLLSRLREKFESIVLQQNPALSSAFALAEIESERLGSEIHLFFESHVAAEAVQSVQKVYNETVLPFERIRETKAIAKIPRTDLGKILYSELKSAHIIKKDG